MCETSEIQIAGKCHSKTSKHRDAGGVVRDLGKSVHGWLLKRSVDEQAIVVADEGKRDDTDSLEDAIVNDQGTLDRTLHLSRNPRALGDDCDNNDEHTD